MVKHLFLVNELCLETKPFFVWIFFILTENKETHIILDGFKFRQDPTRDL